MLPESGTGVRFTRAILFTALLGTAGLAQAAEFGSTSASFPQWATVTALIIFVIAVVLSSAEEFIDLRKSKPMLLAGGIIWGLIAWINTEQGLGLDPEGAARAALVHYLELMLYLLVIMAYMNALVERRFFATLRKEVSRLGYGWRKLFWITGGSAFFLSPIVDNLSVAVLTGTAVIALGRDYRKFTVLGCINVVVASNAGGSFSPVGDLTTLLLWQTDIVTPQGPLSFSSFFLIFVPALVAWIIPAAIMQTALHSDSRPPVLEEEPMRRGAISVVVLFLATLLTAILFKLWLQLPPVVGMMTGLAYLQIFGYYLKKTYKSTKNLNGSDTERLGGPVPLDGSRPFDVFISIARAEWDAMLFICGIFLAIGGLWYLGWLALTETFLYGNLGPLTGNIVAGIFSAFVENLPTMFGILSMEPNFSLGHWLLAALTVATGGSLLSVGSAAGVALMGQAQNAYTFWAHLRWTPVILLGYIAAILTHLWLNAGIL